MRKWKTSILINACVILLVISTISFMLLLFIFQISTFKKNGGKAISLELTAPPPRLFFSFFCQRGKTAIKRENPKPNNQMALDKQLIHVFSSPSTWKKSLFLQVRWILTPRPTLKRTKKKKNHAISRPRSHLQTNVIFQF